MKCQELIRYIEKHGCEFLYEGDNHTVYVNRKEKDVLNNLDYAEKAVLRKFYIQDKYTIELPMDNPTLVGLRNKGIVYIVGKYGQHTLQACSYHLL